MSLGDIQFYGGTCVSSGNGFSCLGIFYDALPTNSTNSTAQCDRFYDSDIAGTGVILAFVIPVFLSFLTSHAAMFLDIALGGGYAWMPKPMRTLIPIANSADRPYVRMWRNILERLILGFVDQQLVTGCAVLVIAWIKLFSNSWSNATPNDSMAIKMFHLPSANLSLVTWLCCASSSAHLAGVMVLDGYFAKYRDTGRLRIGLMIAFSILLTITIAMASSVAPYFLIFAYRCVIPVLGIKSEPGRTKAALTISIILPIMIMIWLFWICTLQLLPRWRDMTKGWITVRLLYPLRKLLPHERRATKGLPLSQGGQPRWKKIFISMFWFVILGNRRLVFLGHMALTIWSLVWCLRQRYEGPPVSMDRELDLCPMSDVPFGYGIWSFGQLLPMVLLFLPFLSAAETYIEERDGMRQADCEELKAPSVSSSVYEQETHLLQPPHPGVQYHGIAYHMQRQSYHRLPSDSSLPRFNVN